VDPARKPDPGSNTRPAIGISRPRCRRRTRRSRRTRASPSSGAATRSCSLQMGDNVILTDPVFTSPVGRLSKLLVERWVDPERLPSIDVVLVSHMLFDHPGATCLREAKRTGVVAAARRTPAVPSSPPVRSPTGRAGGDSLVERQRVADVRGFAPDERHRGEPLPVLLVELFAQHPGLRRESHLRNRVEARLCRAAIAARELVE
jgi:hypothetical protein